MLAGALSHGRQFGYRVWQEFMITIRQETPQDIRAIGEVYKKAFGEPYSARLVGLLRERGKLIVALVAVDEKDQVVGHISFAPVEIELPHPGLRGACLALAAVTPRRQKHGIGSQLVREGLQVCQDLGIDFIVAQSEPGFLECFGFSPTNEYGLQVDKIFSQDFWAREIRSGALAEVSGNVQYPIEFDEVERKAKRRRWINFALLNLILMVVFGSVLYESGMPFREIIARILIIPIMFGLLFGMFFAIAGGITLLAKLFPAQSELSDLSLDEATLKTYNNWKLKSLALLFILALVFGFFNYWILSKAARLWQAHLGGYLLPMPNAYWGVLAIFWGLLFAYWAADWLTDRMLGEKVALYQRIADAEFGLDNRKVNRLVLGAVLIFLIPLSLLGMDAYTRFGEREIAINRFLGLGEIRYNYTQIEQVVLESCVCENDEVRLKIYFDDGEHWRTDPFEDTPVPIEYREIINRSVQKSGQPLVRAD
jgi:putative acetyltransferase